MRRIFHLFCFLALGSIFLLTSCSEDEPVYTQPGISFGTGTGLISADVSIPIYSPVKISLTAAKGSEPLKYIQVKVDGILLPPLTFKINGSGANANPALLIGEDKNGITNTYEFLSSTEPDTILYEFTIADDKDSLITKTLSVIFTGTPATTRATGLIVYNYSGNRLGGLDLYNAKVVSGNDPNAHIRDFGVVDPQSNFTWVKKFKPLQGSVIKNPPTGLSFAEISYQEDIIYLFDNGSNDVGSIDTKVLAKGDFFVVKNGTSYFAISIDNLTATANDNLDNYEVSLKR